MRRATAVLVAAAVLWPVVTASAATADPTPIPEPTPTPSPTHPPGAFDYPPPWLIRFTAEPMSPITAGIPTTITATIGWQVPDTTGDITFTDNDATLDTQTVPISGQATAAITVTLPVGHHTLRVTFVGRCPYGQGPGYSFGCGIGVDTAGSAEYAVEPVATPTVAPSPTPTLALGRFPPGFFRQLMARLLRQLGIDGRVAVR